MRLAFFSPLPPAPTGIADYSADVVALLDSCYSVDVFHDQDEIDSARLPPGVCAARASTFDPRGYDLAIYQMGNGAAHGFLYPLLARAPGLLVLHDLVLHHARAKAFLDSPEAAAYAAAPSDARLREGARARLDEYRAELRYSYPRGGDLIAEVQLGTVGPLLPYAYPLFRLPVEFSRLTACHNDFMVDAVAAEVPESRPVRIPMAMTRAAVEKDAVLALRLGLGLPPGALVVGAFGLLTREKQIETVVRAVARTIRALPHLRLLLVGPVPDRAGLDGLLTRLGVMDRAVVTGRVPLPELAAHIEAADIVAHLRYPTARETSAALLRILAQGRPTVLSDLAHLADIPEDAVVRLSVEDEEGELTRAILSLAEDGPSRARLGERASAFIALHHSPAQCLDGYVAAIEEALRRPLPQPREWPAHWRG